MKDKIEQNMRELQNAIMVAQLNYEIWCVYKEKKSSKRFMDTLNAYPLFFTTSLHAHFVAMIIALYRLFEKRNDSINMSQLIDLLEKGGFIPHKEVERFKNKIKNIKPLWIKISVLRNNLFAHRSNAFYNDDIWKLANVKPNEIKAIIDKSKSLINEITFIWDRSRCAFNLSATEDTIELLEDLKRLNDEK